MNQSIRRMGTVAIVLLLALIVNLTYIQAFQTKQLAEHPRNGRQYQEALKVERGQIYASGEILAHSVADEDGAYHREYPQSTAAFGPVLGYFSNRYGASGLEASQNSILSGTDDSLFVSRAWDMITGHTSGGANVELTVLPNTQQVAYEQLSSQGYTGSVVALRPSTGEVLAMATTPSYDANSIVSGDAETEEANFNALQADESAPMLNRATQQIQPPGSTFKVLTTAAALTKGESKNSMVNGNPVVTLPNTEATLENYDGQSCGGSQVTLMEAFRKSCNTAFVDLSLRTGADALRDTAAAFGVGETYDHLGVSNVASTIGQIPDDAALAQSSIGQRDVTFTPLQNAVIAATIANDCRRMDPYMVKQITGSDLSALRTTKPRELNQACDPAIAEQLTEMMLAAEQHAGGGDPTIASKTGTAEHGVDSRNSNPHAWYIAFSTTSDVAVAVLVENGGNSGQAATGGSVAAPIGRAVIQAAQQEQQ